MRLCYLTALISTICMAFAMPPTIIQPLKQSSNDYIGFVFSGAAARIAQEAALAKALIEGLSPSKERIIPSVITGSSAGTLNAVAVNAILRSKHNNDTKFTWEDYEQLLFSLTDSSIFYDSAGAIADILIKNIPAGYVFDTAPLRQTITKATQAMGFTLFGDLYLPTVISTVNKDTGETIRMSSIDPQYQKLSIVDVMMASAAMPIAFPPQTIPGIANTTFIDGATGEDEIPTFAMLNYKWPKPVTAFFIIARQFYYGSYVPSIVQSLKFAVIVIQTEEYFRQALYVSGLEEAKSQQQIPAYSYIPQLKDEFGMLDFASQEKQFNETMAWAVANNPTRLN